VSRWAVVGGGLLGMTLAHRLAQRGHQVTLLEGADSLGGLASPWALGDVTWDRHYHVTLASDARLRALLGELGLDDDLRWVKTKTGYYAGPGRLYPLNDALDFLRLPALSPVGKARLAFTILYGSRIRDGIRLERVPVTTWLRRWSGRSTYERLWLPLLRAKLGDNAEAASAAFVWATIQRLYAARQAGLKEELFGYLPGGGYARTLAVFADRLAADGVEVRLSTNVQKVVCANQLSGITVETDGGDLDVDECVVTLAAPLAARICEGLTGDERARLEAVRYQGIVCASVLLRRPLQPYYLTYLTDPAAPFTAVVEMTALVDPAELGGHGLVYLPKYVTPDDPLFEATDTELRAAWLPYLRAMHPGLAEEDVLAFQVSRVRHVMAVATLDYSAHLPPMRTSVPGLHLASSAHIVNGTLNVDETVGLAERAVGVIDP
jgi:protoporphyrinogen oxidase